MVFECSRAVSETVARRIVLSGLVQGIGLRPAVARWAAESAVAGAVRNTPRGVEIEVEGPPRQVGCFCQGLELHLPAAARISGRRTERIAPAGRGEFAIESSASDGPLEAAVPVDLAACENCLAEVAAAGNRRHLYAFTSCTACGPRYSIIENLPYDRAATSMARFEMCHRCRKEYEAPSVRRFHAQTNACPDCGPDVWCCEPSGVMSAEGAAAVDLAVRSILAGDILALRGVGGYQLIADATSQETVLRLRARKQRPARPLAVLVDSLETATRLAWLDDMERRTLADPSNPIVVARVRPLSVLAPSVQQGLDSMGLMLPTTPLHWLIAADCGRPLVATSGNREGEPLAATIDQSCRQLHDVADLLLHHDRSIRRPVDDSVVRVAGGRIVTMRLARGLGPLALDLPSRRHVLALGGHMKAAVALTNGRQTVLGPHIGDLDDLQVRERFVSHVQDMLVLYDARPELLVHDEHPDYFTTRWAAERKTPTMAVQHHHAHVVACMLEHGWLKREVLGVSFDGTGYGADGAIWGGEFLVATAVGFRRVARLRPFGLPGGEAAIREPWRVAVSLVSRALSPQATRKLQWQGGQSRVERIVRIVDQEQFSPTTSSAGRLFDGVAALILGIERSQFEGQAAMLLESACDPTIEGTYPLPLVEGPLIELDWGQLVAAILADRTAGVSPAAMATRFHRALAAGILAVARRFAQLPVVLSGGVFQNRMLVDFILEGWSHRQPLGLPGMIPPGDGGLAAGQLAVAVARLNEGEAICA